MEYKEYVEIERIASRLSGLISKTGSVVAGVEFSPSVRLGLQLSFTLQEMAKQCEQLSSLKDGGSLRPEAMQTISEHREKLDKSNRVMHGLQHNVDSLEARLATSGKFLICIFSRPRG